MQPSDTAYPRFKSRPSSAELERFYTPCENERTFCDSHTRSQTTRLGFVLLLKTYQRLGYFVTSEQVPDAIIEHVAAAVTESGDREALRQYDLSQARRKHVAAVREFLEVKPFDAGGKALMREAFREAALAKEDVADLINIGIETLVRDRYELPAFDTLEREARAQRAATNQALFAQVNSALSGADRSLFDRLFVVGDPPRRVSPWNDLKQDPAKPTRDGMRQLVARYDQLTGMAGHTHVLKAIPRVKVRQWALEGGGLDAASMADLEPNKRYAVTLALISQRLARVTDDLCDLFCKQMRRVTRLAETALENYLADNQEKTDEILRRYATLETLLNSDCPEAEQLQAVRDAVTARPDLCEFSRLHAEHGGKNARRFMWHFFKHRRAELLRILGKLKPVSTSQDVSFERSLVFMLGLRQRHGEWVELKPGRENEFSLADLEWIPDPWRKLVIGAGQPGTHPTRLNRRQFEVCVCAQTVRELKSGDLCVVGGAGDPASALVAKVLDRAIAALMRVRNELDAAALDRAIALLANARTIEFYGAGNSGITAADAQHKFFRLGAPTVAYADAHIHGMAATLLQPGDVVVAISNTGRTRDLLRSVESARQAGADVVAITATGSPLANLSTVALCADVEEDPDVYSPMTSRIAHLAIIDVLAVGVALSRGPGLLAKLEKAKQSLRERRVPRQKAGAARSSGAPGAETGINQGSSQ